MSTNEIVYLAGLPRSGSTLLCNVLAQNPSFYVTPTNGLINVLGNFHGNNGHKAEVWHRDGLFRSQDMAQIQKRAYNCMRGIMEGWYHDELAAGKTVFDKNRGWTASINLLEKIFDKRVKIIFPIRSLVEVVASFEKLHRESPAINRSSTNNIPWAAQQSMDGRAMNLFLPHELVGMAIARIRDCFDQGLSDRLFFVNYDRFMADPHTVMREMHRFLGVPEFTYDFENIKQLIFENDIYHSFEYGKLHNIKEGSLFAVKKTDYSKYISPRMIKHIRENYADYERLVERTRDAFIINSK